MLEAVIQSTAFTGLQCIEGAAISVRVTVCGSFYALLRVSFGSGLQPLSGSRNAEIENGNLISIRFSIV